MISLTELEALVFNKLVESDVTHLQLLKQQHQCIQKIQIDKSPSGVFFHYDLTPEGYSLFDEDTQFGDLTLKINGIDMFAGVILFISKGRINTLEIYSFDGFWPENIESCEVKLG
ncbi:hypothetical protein [Algicola sagamiensis]|uniref:hypothetical protein n=1 Tax=Algicola sagamiensis TaxID=163869 RepID=UPI000373F078|nr:hypothetical protein [Algicola sagamiensis]